METEVKLFAPKTYWAASDAARAEVCNGCGPGRIGGDLVPDTLWGLRVTRACDIHDWMYRMGETIEDKNEADRTFLNNMLRLVDGRTKYGCLRWLRARRAYVYYQAVRAFGGPAFWSGKNPDGTERAV